MQKILGRSFRAYGKPLDTVTSFKYLGRVITAGDDNWPVVTSNLIKAQKSWTRMTRILGWEGEDPRISSLFFKVVVQAVLLFGLETWVMNPCMERALGSFQHRVAQRTNESQPRRRREGG